MRRLLFILLLALPALAQTDADILRHLRPDFQKHAFFIRGFYQDSLLHYDSAGNLLHRGQSGSWTTAFLYVKKVALENGRLELQGIRAVQVFNDHSRKFDLRRTNLKVLVTVESGSPATENTFRKALGAVFIDPKEPVSPLVPEYWHWFFAHLDANGVLPREPKRDEQPLPCPSNPSVNQPCRVSPSGGVKPPKTTHTPDPTYNDFGRTFQIQGMTILSLVVDETGHPQSIAIVKPLGCGLDENTIDTVRNWTFQPATRDGQPVPVKINVEVDYRWGP